MGLYLMIIALMFISYLIGYYRGGKSMFNYMKEKEVKDGNEWSM